MRRHPLLLVLFALVVGLGLGGSAAGAATPNDTSCRKLVSGSVSHAELLKYDACRFDRIDSQLAAMRTAAAATSPTTPVSTTQPAPAPPTQPSTTTSPTPPTPTSTSTGYPDAGTTGVPSATSLQRVPEDVSSGAGWSWKGGADQCIHVETDGAVLSGLNITGCIEVYANNVTIQNTRVTAAGDGWAVGARGVSGLTVKDSTLSGGGKRMAVGVKDVTGSSSVTVLRVDVSGYSSGLQLSRGLVQDSYIHDPILQPGDHTNGFTHNGGRSDGSLTLRHNTILNKFDQADAISFFQDFGTIKNVTADNNLVAGGSYALYGGAGGRGTSSNVTITNNRFSTRYFPNGGTFGPACCYDKVAGNTWSGNVWADGAKAGQTIPAP